MIEIKQSLKAQDLSPKLDRFWAASAEKMKQFSIVEVFSM